MVFFKTTSGFIYRIYWNLVILYIIPGMENKKIQKSKIFQPLFVWLESEYGAKGALLIYSGITAHSCIGGALLRPLEKVQVHFDSNY